MTRVGGRETREQMGELTRQAVEALRRFGPMTADECAEVIGATPFSLRPRFSELHVGGHISWTGLRRRNSSGRKANVWRLS